MGWFFGDGKRGRMGGDGKGMGMEILVERGKGRGGVERGKGRGGGEGKLEI